MLCFSNFHDCVYLQGKAGSEPSAIELTEALKTHDLFLYFGHGSGMIPLAHWILNRLFVNRLWCNLRLLEIDF